jgi:hypothetical protein
MFFEELVTQLLGLFLVVRKGFGYVDTLGDVLEVPSVSAGLAHMVGIG